MGQAIPDQPIRGQELTRHTHSWGRVWDRLVWWVPAFPYLCYRSISLNLKCSFQILYIPAIVFIKYLNVIYSESSLFHRCVLPFFQFSSMKNRSILMQCHQHEKVRRMIYVGHAYFFLFLITCKIQ